MTEVSPTGARSVKQSWFIVTVMRILLASFVVASAVVVTAATANVSENRPERRKPSVEADLRKLSNDDVDWDGNVFGLWPRVNARGERVAAAGANAIRPLRRALRDPGKYVAAHVLLTWLTGPYCSSGSAFNGLRVTLHADGRTTIADQRAEIEKFWASSPSKQAECSDEDVADR
jgi:hypothetical protein